MKRKTRQILAILAIALLAALYLINLVLALIGSDAARSMLKATMTLSIMVPILLYVILMFLKKNPGTPRDEGESLTEEQREEARKKLREADRKGRQPLSDPAEQKRGPEDS